MSVREQMEAIDWDAVWDNMLARLEADGIDTKLLLARVAANLRRGSVDTDFWLAEPVQEEPRRTMPTPSGRRQTIRLANRLARLDAQNLCAEYAYKRPLADSVVEDWLQFVLEHITVPARWRAVFGREYKRSLRRVVALIDCPRTIYIGHGFVVCDQLPDANDNDDIKAGCYAYVRKEVATYQAAYVDESAKKLVWVQVAKGQPGSEWVDRVQLEMLRILKMT